MVRMEPGTPASDQYYLSGLLRCCDEVMWSVSRGMDRRYRCAVCGQGVDALAAEVEVWERAHLRRPSLGTPHTPYHQRGAALRRALSRVDVVRSGNGVRFVIRDG
ncbi:hypothetical protein GCM10009682_03090 [Luedemannella flava]|uniref:Uncharacterized protein n=1 Tax=Luedemannella flava TaxID=349316 RepID=A0ABN2LDA2_9ACTN